MKIWDYKEDFRKYLKMKYPFAKIKFLGEDVNNRLLVFTVGYEPKDPRLADLRLTFSKEDIKIIRKIKLEQINESTNI